MWVISYRYVVGFKYDNGIRWTTPTEMIGFTDEDPGTFARRWKRDEEAVLDRPYDVEKGPHRIERLELIFSAFPCEGLHPDG